MVRLTKITNVINTSSTTSEETLHRIYISMRPILSACKAVGLNPLKIVQNRVQNQPTTSEKNSQYFYFTFYLTIYTFLSIYSLFSLITDDRNFVIANKYIFFAEYSVMIFLMLTTVIFTFLFRKLQTKALDLLSHIDVSFFRSGYKLDYKTLLKTNYIILIVVGISLILRSTLLIITIHMSFVQKITLILSAAIKAFSKYQFVIFVLQLQIRFTKINEIIKSYYEKNSKMTKLVLNPAVKIIPQSLYVLCRLHYKLSSVMQKVNSAFAVQLLTSIGVSLFDVLFQSYYLYYVATGKSVTVSAGMILCPMAWLLDETIEIYWLVNACASTCDQANETPTILHELRNNYFDMDIETHVQTYSLQMLHQKVQFSVLGFFVIDFTLIYSIAGAVTTYLVIFIQFDQSSSSQDGNELIISNSTESPVLQG